MKIVIYMLLIFAYIYFLIVCFLWLITYGSGHNIPRETNIWLIRMTILSIFLIVIFTKMKIKGDR